MADYIAQDSACLKNHLSTPWADFFQPHNSWCDFAGVCVCVLLLTNICVKWFLYLVAICDLGWALSRFHVPAAPWSCQFARTSKTWQRLRVRFGHWSFRNEASTRKALKSSVGELHGIVVQFLYCCHCLCYTHVHVRIGWLYLHTEQYVYKCIFTYWYQIHLWFYIQYM